MAGPEETLRVMVMQVTLMEEEVVELGVHPGLIQPETAAWVRLVQ